MKYQILTLPVTGYRLWLWQHCFGSYYPNQDAYSKYNTSKKKHWLKRKIVRRKENYKTLAVQPISPHKPSIYFLPMFNHFFGYLLVQFSWICTLWNSLNTLTAISSTKDYGLRLVFGNQKLAVSHYLKSFREQLKLL